jgi:hypothetical protein
MDAGAVGACAVPRRQAGGAIYQFINRPKDRQATAHNGLFTVRTAFSMVIQRRGVPGA